MKRNIMLSPDAAEGADPLDTDLSTIDTSYPVLPASTYLFKISGAKVARNKADNGDLLVVPLQTVEKTQDKHGEEVLPGLTITHRVGLTPTDKYSDGAINKNLARIVKAAGLTGVTKKSLVENPAMLDGKTLRAKVKVVKETSEYPESNSISDFAAA